MKLMFVIYKRKYGYWPYMIHCEPNSKLFSYNILKPLI